MNENNTYIVQCTGDNFDDVRHMVQLFSSIIDVDNNNFSIRTFSLDSIMKQRLTEIGVGFWEETSRIMRRA